MERRRGEIRGAPNWFWEGSGIAGKGINRGIREGKAEEEIYRLGTCYRGDILVSPAAAAAASASARETGWMEWACAASLPLSVEEWGGGAVMKPSGAPATISEAANALVARW